MGDVRFFIVAPSIISVSRGFDVVCIQGQYNLKLFKQFINKTPWVSTQPIKPEIAHSLMDTMQGWSVGCYTPGDDPIDEMITQDEKQGLSYRAWEVMSGQIGSTLGFGYEPMAIQIDEVIYGNC